MNVSKTTYLIYNFYMSVFRIHIKADTMTYIPTALYVSSALYMRTAPDSYLSWRKCYSVWYSPVAGLPTGNLILVDSTNNSKKLTSCGSFLLCPIHYTERSLHSVRVQLIIYLLCNPTQKMKQEACFVSSSAIIY